MTVTVAQPQNQQLSQRLSANGSVAAWQEASVGAEIGGLRLTQVRVNVGDQVKAGQVLAVFANESVLAEINQAKAA
jgi:HlyD family secretion protein